MSDLDFDLAQLDRAEHFPRLTQFEWEALGRMSEKVGTLAVKSLLRSSDRNAQRLATQEFMTVELADARAQALKTLARQPRVEPLKIDTTKYSGDEKDAAAQMVLRAGRSPRSSPDPRCRTASSICDVPAHRASQILGVRPQVG